MAEAARRGRRGPKPDPGRGRPSGYRITEDTRFELQAAALFVGTNSLQDTIALAVEEFLDRLRTTDGFRDAMRAAQANQQRRANRPGTAKVQTRRKATDSSSREPGTAISRRPHPSPDPTARTTKAHGSERPTPK